MMDEIHSDYLNAYIKKLETTLDTTLGKIRVETQKRPMCLPGSPELIDELIAQLERAGRMTRIFSEGQEWTCPTCGNDVFEKVNEGLRCPECKFIW